MNGIELIAAERQRQIDGEGFTITHDDEHCNGELAMAAACYAAPPHVHLRYLVWKEKTGNPYGEFVTRDPWPWDRVWDKRPSAGCCSADKQRALVKAGALIAAEIDRLQRAAALALVKRYPPKI